MEWSWCSHPWDRLRWIRARVVRRPRPAQKFSEHRDARTHWRSFYSWKLILDKVLESSEFSRVLKRLQVLATTEINRMPVNVRFGMALPNRNCRRHPTTAGAMECLTNWQRFENFDARNAQVAGRRKTLARFS